DWSAEDWSAEDWSAEDWSAEDWSAEDSPAADPASAVRRLESGDVLPESSRRHSPDRVGSPTIVISRCSSEDITAWGSRAVASADTSHRPSFVMAIGTMSYLDLSIALMTDSADRSETSCSPERPPNITPTRSFEFGVRAAVASSAESFFTVRFP